MKNLCSHDKGNTFRTILETLKNDLGYQVQWKIINGSHFVPQHRERIIIVGFSEPNQFDFSSLALPNIHTSPKLSSILHKQNGDEVDVDGGRYINSKGKVHDKYTLTPRLWEYLQQHAEKHRARGNGFGFGLFSENDTARTLSARYYKDGSEILIKQKNSETPRRLTPSVNSPFYELTF